MENWRNENAIVAEDGNILKSREMNDQSKSHNDIMTRRLKNRERQRRYRARKRLEADKKKDFVSNQSTKPQGNVELNGNHNNYVSRVHCKRKWKKDARRAHACQILEEAPGAANFSYLAPQIAVEAQSVSANHAENSIGFPDSETKGNVSARNWKAEARRKKN